MSEKAPRSYSTRDLKILFAKSGNRCAFPGCSHHIVDDNDVVIGEVCHIEGLNKKSARFNSGLPIKDRRKGANLMLMCGVHHKTVDDLPKKYTVDVLRKMKECRSLSGRIELLPSDEKIAEALHKHLAYMEAAGKRERPQPRTNVRAKANAKNGIFSTGDHSNNTVNNTTNNTTNNKYYGTRKQPAATPTSGAIGHDCEMKGYIEYLNDYAIKFTAQMDTGRGQASSEEDVKRAYKKAGVIVARKIKTKFNATRSHVSQKSFGALVEFLQGIIKQTAIGRMHMARGTRAYDSFEEWKRKTQSK